jgi:hypothetical protein
MCEGRDLDEAVAGSERSSPLNRSNADVHFQLDAGISAPEHRRPKPYSLPTAKLDRVREGVDLDAALHVAERLEAAEVARKIERRK